MTVTVGGPPRGAHTLSRVCVLRGTSAATWTPQLPGTRMILSKPDPVTGLRKRRRDQSCPWMHVGARTALADYLAARHDDREIVLFQLDQHHHVHVYDGRGRLVEDLAGGPTDEPTARVLARAEWFRLREDAAAAPWRWEVQTS